MCNAWAGEIDDAKLRVTSGESGSSLATRHFPFVSLGRIRPGKRGKPTTGMARMDRDLTQVRAARVTRITAEDWRSASGARAVARES